MKIKLVLTGKTEEKYIIEGFSLYEKRIKHYIPFEVYVLPSAKGSVKLAPTQIKEQESTFQMKNIGDSDYIVLLDELGKEYRSIELASFIQQRMNSSVKCLVFLIGGSYGFSQEMYKRANMKLSLSKLTFSHQIVRLLFMEQLYRAFTIIKNEPYHHEG
ncbi:MAG TPA: 23S rRNA (pseudouridine(1915)-N(3))-methyltransferase RlmH [Bacteroidales bacterium]|nr:23S rRNA (pseudouridine(1915)-N(3))-methyltransferase RlmH [Bacteroidales bacterium]HPS17135.1 23S rRNA (pseudouridine(1915)-N(3))-methyltransferase RlmH [Bacteroidales bacterium]